MEHTPHSPLTRWLPWILGGAALIAVVSVSLHFSEGASFVALARDARPTWLALAALCQVGTYAAEGELWRGITCRAGCRLTLIQAIQLSIGKLFIDQAVPTGGVSGSIMAASALNKRGVSQHVVTATVIVERASFLAAYALALCLAIGLSIGAGHPNPVVLIGGGLFAVVAAGAAWLMLALAGRRWTTPAWVASWRWADRTFVWLRGGERAIVSNPHIVLYAISLQLAVIALDASTMLLVVRALGAHLPIASVFVSFMISSLFRTLGVLPGGLGTFEASSTMTLRMAGAAMPVAISATMLFRGLSYWLPMIPGLWFARRLTRHPKVNASRAPAAAPDDRSVGTRPSRSPAAR